MMNQIHDDLIQPIQLVDGPSLAGAVLRERQQTGSQAKRTLTGMVNGKRRRKFSLIQLPNGIIGELLAASRGRVCVRYNDPSQIDPIQLAWVEEKHVTFVPNPAAKTLGSLKAGVKERPSQKKLESCRRNARRPKRRKNSNQMKA